MNVTLICVTCGRMLEAWILRKPVRTRPPRGVRGLWIAILRRYWLGSNSTAFASKPWRKTLRPRSTPAAGRHHCQTLPQ